jgi:hypothetical protein
MNLINHSLNLNWGFSMRLFVELEKDDEIADEFMMAKCVFDLCKEFELCEETVAKMILVQSENSIRTFSKYMNRPEVRPEGPVKLGDLLAK